jgi:coenzyme F420-reducing hydrogenase delta subunit
MNENHIYEAARNDGKQRYWRNLRAVREVVRRMKVVVLYCQNCVAAGAENSTAPSDQDGVTVQAVMMPCSSKAQPSELLKILAAGADGVEVVACPDGTCRQLVGSRMAEKRMQYAQRLLKEAHVGGDRLGHSFRAGLTAGGLREIGLARAAVVAASRKGEGR